MAWANAGWGYSLSATICFFIRFACSLVVVLALLAWLLLLLLLLLLLNDISGEGALVATYIISAFQFKYCMQTICRQYLICQ
jgi:hypothetical protein